MRSRRCVREITERFVPLAGSAALRLRTELDERLVAPVDAECLHQILINLLDNAVKYGGGRRDRPGLAP